jgi:hypothetical protein
MSAVSAVLRSAVLCAGALLATVLLACAPGSASALTFVEAPGSPYSTTDQHFVPSPGGFLGGAAVGDFNNDGISDLAVVNGTGLPAFSGGESVTVLLGHPEGGLTMAAGSPVELYSGGIFASKGAVATGDFNNDGNLDLAVVDNTHDTISILLGDGTGHFRLSGAPIPFAGGEPKAIAVGDFNGDGVKDLAFASGNDVNVLLGNGSGGFAPAPGAPFALTGHAAGEYPVAVAAGNFNADDLSDLAVTTSSDRVAIYLATGDGEFHEVEEPPLTTDEAPESIVADDLNGDGKTDLAIASGRVGSVTVLLGDGSGGFVPAAGSPFAVPGGPNASAGRPGLPDSIVAGDFDGDGNMDLAVANFNGSSDNVAVLLGDGHGGFANAVGSPFPANGNPGPLAVGDFNGDGRPDLAVVNPFEGVVTVLQNTTGVPETPEVPETPLPSPGPVESAPGPGAAHSTEGAHGTTPGQVSPTILTRAQILALIARQLEPSDDWSRLRPSTKSAGFMLKFKAPVAGTAVVDWYAAPDGRQQAPDRAARDAHIQPVILASGTLTFSTATSKLMRVSLTKADKLLWKRAGQLKLIERETFTPIGMAPVTAVRTVAFQK